MQEISMINEKLQEDSHLQMHKQEVQESYVGSQGFVNTLILGFVLFYSKKNFVRFLQKLI